MKKWLTAILFGTMLVLAACGGGGGSSDNANDGGSQDDGGTVDTAAGQDIYKKSCASCHGDDLSGTVGPSLETVGADHSVDDIIDIIENGQGAMPAGLVSGDDAQAVAEWLATHK